IADIPNAIAAPKNVPVYDTTALADHGPRGGHYRVVCLLQNFNPIKTRGVRGDGGTQGRTASVCGTSECADSHHA
ncbi:hypothetical protein, partial [Yoonia sp.]|uniref:hypothetical protein n=1 Tax=Yoonia sp. TaxID=2212373 RepID=UPI0025DA3E4C